MTSLWLEALTAEDALWQHQWQCYLMLVSVLQSMGEEMISACKSSAGGDK